MMPEPMTVAVRSNDDPKPSARRARRFVFKTSLVAPSLLPISRSFALSVMAVERADGQIREELDPSFELVERLAESSRRLHVGAFRAAARIRDAPVRRHRVALAISGHT